MRRISNGYHTNHLLFYCYNGDLYGVGENLFGQLGIGEDIEETDKPILLKNDKNIKAICLGNDYTFILYKNGDLYGFGRNDFGQLGTGNYKHQYEAVLVMKDPTIISISCGGSHTMIHKENGELFVFGDNQHGQLGIGNSKIKRQLTQTLLMVDNTIKMIRLGYRHSAIYKENGDLLVFGYNYNGQLGFGDNKKRNIPTLLLNDVDIQDIVCGNDLTIYHKKNGEIFFLEKNVTKTWDQKKRKGY